MTNPITQFEPLIRGLVRRYRWTGIHADDLRSAAIEGVLRGLAAHDPDRGHVVTVVQFHARAAVNEEIARMRGAVSVSRGSRTSKATAAAKRVKAGEDVEIVSEDAGVSTDRITAIIRAHAPSAELDDNATDDPDLIDRISVDAALSALDPRSRAIIRAIDFLGIDTDTVARALKISRTRVNQIRVEAMKKMRERLE